MSKPLSLGKIFAIIIIIGILFGAFIGFSQAKNLLTMQQIQKLYMLFLLALSLFSLPASILWWRKADEAVREAHKWAWFWGGSFAMVLGLGLLALDGLMDGIIGAGITEAFVYVGSGFQAGFLMALVLLTIGYGFAWLLWWAKRR